MKNRDDIHITAGTGGIGVIDVLQIVFIILKLCHVINWSWIWVLSPLWISTIILILFVIIIIIIYSRSQE